MKLWLIIDILGYCAACWEDVEHAPDSDYTTKIREEYADELILAGLIEGVSSGMRTIYRRTELGELLTMLAGNKPFYQYMELDDIVATLKDWDKIRDKYSSEEESDNSDVGMLVVRRMPEWR